MRTQRKSAPALSTIALQHGKFARMSARIVPALLVAATLVSGAALAADEPLTPTAQPAPPIGILPAPGEAPKQPASRPRLSPSQIYAREHARRQQSAPRFATVRPTQRKPDPTDTAENPKTAGEASKLPPSNVGKSAVAAGAAAAAATQAPAPAAAAPKPTAAPATCACAPEGEAAKQAAAKPRRRNTAVAKSTTTTTTTRTTTQTATASLPAPAAAPMPEIIVRPTQLTPAMMYENAARQYRNLRRRDLDQVRHLLTPDEYATKLGAIEASYQPGQ